MPDDATVVARREFLSRLHAEILIVPADLLDAAVEEDKVVDDLEKPRLVTELQQLAIEATLAL